ncbi:MAG: hypothetical protein JXR90_11545 [Spirochaetes bacterium]|nr:hypothetical protein [Spirochaetota bacterium]
MTYSASALIVLSLLTLLAVYTSNSAKEKTSKSSVYFFGWAGIVFFFMQIIGIIQMGVHGSLLFHSTIHWIKYGIILMNMSISLLLAYRENALLIIAYNEKQNMTPIFSFFNNARATRGLLGLAGALFGFLLTSIISSGKLPKLAISNIEQDRKKALEYFSVFSKRLTWFAFLPCFFAWHTYTMCVRFSERLIINSYREENIFSSFIIILNIFENSDSICIPLFSLWSERKFFNRIAP